MIIPTILEKDFNEIKRKIFLVDDTAEMIQIDFADNKLVRGETFLDIYRLDEINSKSPLDIHLMVVNPTEFVEKKLKKGVKVCTQVEVNPHFLGGFITMANDLGYKTGLSINADTDLKILDDYISMIDFVQFMAVVPGGQEHEFIERVLEKIQTFKKVYPKMRTQVDGGVNKERVEEFIKIGVDDLVIGHEIFNNESPRQALINFMEEEKNERNRKS